MISLGQASVSLELREVFRSGVPLRVGTRAFDILELLLSSPGQLVSKDEILQHVWPDTVVEENNLQVHVSALRKALGADRGLIRTIPGRGYILICGEDDTSPVTAADDTKDAPASILAEPMPRRSDLPHNAALIGRAAALDDVRGALLNSALVSLVGAGGIGKTSLAIAAAHHLSVMDNLSVCFVPLAQVSCPERLVDCIGRALGLALEPERSRIESVVACLQASDQLVILDNCEHLIEGVAAVSEHLLRTCPALKILTTSREPLRIGGERTLNVAPLEIPEPGADRRQVLNSSAAQLFLTRLRALDSFFPCDNACSLDEQSIALIAQVCRQLDGIPLALEMAAGRAASLGLFELAQSLQHSSHLLSGGLRSAPLRHQTLEASVEWSYGLLSVDERTVLERLGRFEGRFSLAQACDIAQTAALSKARVMDCMVGLAQKSLLILVAEGPFRFYRLLSVTRSWLQGRAAEQIAERSGSASSRQGVCYAAPHVLRPVVAHSRATSKAHRTQSESDYFHLNHQRVLATSQ